MQIVSNLLSATKLIKCEMKEQYLYCVKANGVYRQ